MSEDNSDEERWSKIKPHSTPIFQTSVYDYPDLETLDDYYNGRIPGGYIYSRNGLPNSNELGSLVAGYEKTEFGVVCSSGMGALLVAFLSKLKQGDHIVASDGLYGGTTVLLQDELPNYGISCTFVDSTDPGNVSKAIKKNTKMVVVETISNPTMKISDLEGIAKISKEASAIFLVDNTFATPFVARPVEHGADIVMHSATKFLGGHSDLTLGILCGKKEMMKRVSQFCVRSGVIGGPFDSWLACRSASTWELREKKACENAMKLAKFLESVDTVSKVYYPGLASFSQHELATKLLDRGMYGAMLSFDVKGGLAKASSFVKHLSKVCLAPSLGGVRTSVSHPRKTSHRFITTEQQKESGITDAMIRVSVGIEEYDLLEKEFEGALRQV
jgi:cystathionine beta-lyase/cystathionine gamma-synthase